jgi:hypothetical protein
MGTGKGRNFRYKQEKSGREERCEVHLCSEVCRFAVQRVGGSGLSLRMCEQSREVHE